MSGLRLSRDEAMIRARQGSPYRRHLEQQVQVERDAKRAEWTARREARRSASSTREQSSEGLLAHLLHSVLANDVPVAALTAAREQRQTLSELCDRLEDVVKLDGLAAFTDAVESVTTPPSEVLEDAPRSGIRDDALPLSETVDQAGTSTHQDSSTHGAAHSARDTKVEAGTRGGYDSGPRADADPTPGGAA